MNLIQSNSENPATGRCFECGGEFASEIRKHASIPPLIALGLASDIDPVDAEPPPVFIEKNRYCPDCRRQVNQRRSALTLILIILLVVSDAMLLHQ